MRTSLFIHVLFVFIATCGGCRRDQVATAPMARVFTAEQLYADYRLLPGTLATSRPSAEDARAVLGRKDLASTDEIVPREWPTDSGSIRFLYEPNGGKYWAYRINRRNAGDSEWLVGPFALPNGE